MIKTHIHGVKIFQILCKQERRRYRKILLKECVEPRKKRQRMKKIINIMLLKIDKKKNSQRKFLLND